VAETRLGLVNIGKSVPVSEGECDRWDIYSSKSIGQSRWVPGNLLEIEGVHKASMICKDQARP